jgi:hypothetical protein
MAVKNLELAYPAGSSIADVLAMLRDAMIDDLGFTLLEDSIAGSNFFVVQHQAPSEPKSRMILQVRYALVTLSYIAFVPWASWTPGSPGSGSSSVQCSNPDVSGATNRTSRFHRLTTGDGGTFYLDGDDTDGRWFAAHSHSVLDGISPVHTFVSVCSIESPLGTNNGVNYGVLSWTNAIGTGTSSHAVITATRMGLWIPPVNHSGNNSNSHTPHIGADRAVYMCTAPVYWPGDSDGFGCGLTGRGDQPDTYNDGAILFPLAIHNSQPAFRASTTTATRPSGTAFGYRGYARGIHGYNWGAGLSFRSAVQDSLTGSRYLIYPGDPSSVNNTVSYAVKKAD